MPEKMDVTIYTAGSCKGNPGPGGYAAILWWKGKENPICGRKDKSSNNRMELEAVYEAVKKLTKPCNINFKTTSGYIQTGIEHLDTWSKNDWQTAAKAKVQHYDIWQKLLEIRNVKGHTFSCSTASRENDDVAKRCKDLADIQSNLCTFVEVQNA